jgi:hypothetical protein
MRRFAITAAMSLMPWIGIATATGADFSCNTNAARFENVVKLATSKLRGEAANTGTPDECVDIGEGKYLVTVNALPRVQQGVYFIDLNTGEVRQVQGYGITTIEKELPLKDKARRFLTRFDDARTGSTCWHLVVKLPASYENVNLDWQRKRVKCGPSQ